MHVIEYGTPPGQARGLDGWLDLFSSVAGGVSAVEAAKSQARAAESMARAATEERKAAEAKARASELQTRAGLQLALGGQSAIPSWVVPVGIGTGAVGILGIIFFMTRSRRRR